MKQKILVIDDEAPLLMVIAQVLVKFGCDVKTARSASEARELVALEQFDDLLTDVNLPDMNGLDFVLSLTNNRPERIWVMSGHLLQDDTRLKVCAGFIPKPFRAQSLKQLLRTSA